MRGCEDGEQASGYARTPYTHTDVLCTRELAGGNTRGKRTELHSCRCSRSRGSASCRFFRQHRMLCHGSWTGLHSAVVSLELHLLCPNTALGQAWVHVCTSVAGKRGRTVTAPRSDCRANALAPSLTVHRLRTLQRLKAPSPTGSIALRDQIKVNSKVLSKRVGGSRIPS